MGWFRKVLLALGLLCLIVGFGGAAVVYAISDGFRGTLKLTDVEKTASVQSVQNIDIRSDFVDVHFVESPDQEAHFRLTGAMTDQQLGDIDLELETQNGTLTAHVQVQKNKTDWFRFDVFEVIPLLNGTMSKPRLEAALPNRQFAELKLKTDASDVVAAYPLPADLVTMSTSFGDISLAEFAGKSLELQTDAGDIELSFLGARESVKLSTSFGDVEVGFNRLAEEISLAADAGDLTLSLPKVDALRLDLKNEVGDLTVDVPNLQYRVKSIHEIQGEIGAGGPLLKARSEFGEVEVRAE